MPEEEDKTTYNHAFTFGFEVVGLDADGNTQDGKPITGDLLRDSLLLRLSAMDDEGVVAACDGGSSFDSYEEDADEREEAEARLLAFQKNPLMSIEKVGAQLGIRALTHQRDSLFAKAKSLQQSLASALDPDFQKLVKVLYDDEEGLVSLERRELLAAGRSISVPSGTPTVKFDSAAAADAFGDEHMWDDVIDFLIQNFDWDKKSL